MDKELKEYEFSGGAASYIWKNFQDCKERLPDVEKLYEIDWKRWPKRQHNWSTVSKVIEVMRHIAYGFESFYTEGPVSPVEDRIRHNPDCYFVSAFPDRRHVLRLVLDDDDDDSDELIDFGPVIGFSCVVPLTQNGFQRYLNREYTLLTVPRKRLLCKEASTHACWNLFIGASVFLPEVDPPFEQQARKDTQTNGGNVFRGLASQIARLLPRLKWDDSLNRPIVTQRTSEGMPEFPRLMCPLTKRFKGGTFIDRLGFGEPADHRMKFEDDGNFRLYTLDFGRIEQLPKEKFRSAKNFVQYIQALQERELSGN